MSKKGYQRRVSDLTDNETEETYVFDVSSPLLDHKEKPPIAQKTEIEEQAKQLEPKVYVAHEVQQLLGLGKSKTYEYLEQVYQKQSPFRVIKVGRLYRVPKKSFDAWLEMVN